MKKLLFLGPSFEYYKGGAEYQYKILEEYLKNEYEIYYLFRHTNTLEQKKYLNYNYRFRKKWNPNLYTDAHVIYRLIKKLSPDIIYKQGINYTSAVGVYYSRMYNKKMVLKISSKSDVDTKKKKNGLKRIFGIVNYKIAGYVVRNVDIIIYQADYQNILLKSNFGREGDIHIPNFHPIPEKNYKKNFPAKIVWIGNFKRLKKPEIFIDLAENFKDNLSARFIMIGRPGYGVWFNNILNNMRRVQNIEYLKELSIEQVNEVLNGSHIFVNTSDYEGFPNTYIQAWMRKIPVVALNADPDDIIKNEKIGFHSQTFNQLVKDVRVLIEDKKLREEMGERACKYAVSNFTIKNAEKFKDMLKLLV